MRLAIMQPYLFPYLGYFQLLNSVDLFVVYDDVQYIKGGWINRNRILLNGLAHMFAFPVKKGPLSYQIRERYFAEDFNLIAKRFLKTLEVAYRGAPGYSETVQLITDILASDDLNIASFISRSLRIICDYLSIETRFILSSEIDKDPLLKGQDRIIEINRLLGSTHYMNPIGGMELYSREAFQKAGIELSFLRMRPLIYKQFNNEFVPDLSIIDVMMFNLREKIRELLGEYDLL